VGSYAPHDSLPPECQQIRPGRTVCLQVPARNLLSKVDGNTRIPVTRLQKTGYVLLVQNQGGQSTVVNIATSVIGKHNLEIGTRKAQTTHAAEGLRFGSRNRSEQTSPRQDHGQAVCDRSQLRGQYLQRLRDTYEVRYSAARNLATGLPGDTEQRIMICIGGDK
jgi:hypothetical protein